jgi:hypothetical protein
MKKYFATLIYFLPIALFSQNDAQKIIEKCVKAHGGKRYENMAITLDFRQYHFTLKHDGGNFYYTRSMTDSQKVVWRDVINNTSYYRDRNGVKFELTEKERAKHFESINSQVYFMLLPYKLKDKAVILTYLGEGVIDGNKEFKIKVEFKQEGGGKDYKDVFCYWINQKTYLIDYLAYSEGGPRFRKATKRHNANGLIIQDYDNYEIKDKTATTDQYDHIFTEGGATLLSKIEHKNVVWLSRDEARKL